MNKLDIRTYNNRADIVDNTSHPFRLFNPDLEKHPIKPMEVVHDLPDMKQLKFDHQYMYEHLEQHSLNPTLCTNCYPASKYFRSPEPFIQKLYEDNVKWKLMPHASLTIDIPPYIS